MTAAASDFGFSALADFWGQAGQVALKTQQDASRAFADAMKAMPGGGFAIPTDTSGMTEFVKAGQAMAELWKAATGLSGQLAATLAPVTDTASGKNSTVEATLRAMADPSGWLASASWGGMDGAAGNLAEAPQLADLWNAERQQARVVQAWVDVRRRGLEHHAVVLEAWLHAGQEFTRALADGKPAPVGRAMLTLWTDIANRILLETQRSEKFLKTQSAMIRAGTELRLAQRDMAERWAKQFDLPTRTELDDVHRTVTELRRELRTLKRTMRVDAKGAQDNIASARPVAPKSAAKTGAAKAAGPKTTKTGARG